MDVSDKPRVFIGSSTESLEIAYEIQSSLQYSCYCTTWTQGIFIPSSSALECLLEALNDFDFAIFVFSPDDINLIRDDIYCSVRDNVLFETGLFIGKLGRKRVFYVAPKDVEIHLPSDLIGFEPEKYDTNHPSRTAAIGTTCIPIKKQIEKLGRLN